MNAGAMTADETPIDAARRLLREGDIVGTENACRLLLDADHGHPDAWNLLGIASCQLGRHESGAVAFRRALLLDGSRADFHMNLGNALRENGDASQAEQCFRDALALAPEYAQAHYNLGAVLEQQDRMAEARQSYMRALQIDPGFAEAHINLGGILQASGETTAAIDCYRHALDSNPRLAVVWRNLAAIFEEQERLDDSITCCRKALEIEPADGRTLYMLGLLLERLGYTDEAAAYVSRAIKRVAPAAAVPMSLTLATMLPPVLKSRDHILQVRGELGRRLDMLAAAKLRLDVGGCALPPPFFLSYHAIGNRGINEKLAALLLQMNPGLAWVSPHCRNWRGPAGRIKVGFLSRFLRNHSIGKTTRGFFSQIDRSRFETHALFLPPAADDEIAREIRHHAEHSVVLSDSVAAARQQVAALQLDVLFYQDIVMESISYEMSFARLAPVQCLSFGHPDTTGVPAMDYFVSSDLFEPDGAAAHYSEKLVQLRNLGTLAYYDRPLLQQPPKSRAQLGLPRDARLYVCPQTLFKLHPDIDALFAGILRGDRRGHIVLIEGKYPQWAVWLRQRFAQSMPEVHERVVFLKSMGAADFINLLAVADVSLDTPHFNGMNTSLEAFAVGTPVVTLPGEFHRGRHTFGMYRRMAMDECIAQDGETYVSIALRLGTEPAWRKAVSQRILERCSQLFRDTAVVREFERFFTEAVGHASEKQRADDVGSSGIVADDRGAEAEQENRRGNQFAGEGKPAEAEACYRRALAFVPGSVAVLTNLAHVLLQTGRVEEAGDCCRDALTVSPGHAAALDMLGTVHRTAGRWNDAVASYRSALALEPRGLHILNNLGITLLALRQLDEAERCFDVALAIDPERATAHYDKAIVLLLKGDYARGWREYEWRWIHDPEMRQQAGRYVQPRWRGEDLAGKTILLHSEQGLGDGMQFIRYAPLLARRGARVLVNCPRSLARLFAGVPHLTVVEVATAADFDYHCPLLSLPLLSNTTIDTVPADVPYLAADTVRAAHWATRLPADGALRVGVTWTSDQHRYDNVNIVRSKQSRTCPGAALAPLREIAGVHYFSLQKDPPPDDLADLMMTDFMNEMADFADTAALVANLDLVISVDTSVTHLAGALGKPVWLLLPYDNEWRWLLERDDSPWYPTARLFRQRVMGDWAQVIEDVALALSEFSASRQSPDRQAARE